MIPMWGRGSEFMQLLLNKGRVKMNNFLVYRQLLFALIILFAPFIPPVSNLPNPSPTWYVSLSGSDSNSCDSPAAPCATIQAAIDKAASGETVKVTAEIYTSGQWEFAVHIQKGIALSGGWDLTYTAQTGHSTINATGLSQHAIGTNINAPVYIDHFILQKSSTIYCGGLDINRFTSSTSTVYIDHLIVRDNTVNYQGGGICNWSGNLEINHSSITRNKVTESDYGVDDGGAGINFRGGQLTIRNSSITENTNLVGVGGGIRMVNGNVYLENVTVDQNRAGYNGGGLFSYNPATAVHLFNTTISYNRSGTTDGGGIYASSVNMQNSILFGNRNKDNLGSDCYGALVSGGYNLIGSSTSCSITAATGDLLDVFDAKLGPLESQTPDADSLFSRTLLMGSPAIDSANPDGCSGMTGESLLNDQRSMPRFGRCDMGAYEIQPLEYSTKTASRSQVYLNDRIDFTITLQNPDTVNINTVQVVDTIPTGLTYIAGSLEASNGESLYENGVVRWNGDIPAGIPVTIRFGVTVNPDVILGTRLTNTAEIEGDGEKIYRSATILIDYYATYLPCLHKLCFPLFSDNFNNPASGWPVSDDGNVLYEYNNGEYRILIRPTYWMVIARPNYQISEFFVSVDVRKESGTNTSAGLAFGIAPDWKTFYSFEIYSDGYFGLYRFDPKEIVTLAEDFSYAINQGNYTNRIKIERNGYYITASVNGTQLARVRDKTYIGTRYLGLVATSYNYPNVDIRFDNFVVYPIDCDGLTIPETLSASWLPLPYPQIFQYPDRTMSMPNGKQFLLK
jgi:uncharacterized repeat protein (TIGR01451 family)